jgi:hypothetical protein
MTSFFILLYFLIGLLVIGALFYLRKGQRQGSHEEKPDIEYICTLCGDKDCTCDKLDPQSKK